MAVVFMRTIKRPFKKLSDKLLVFTRTLKRPQMTYKFPGLYAPFIFLFRKIASESVKNFPLDNL